MSAVNLPDAAFWRGKRVFLTGHTGFKGGWLALWLARMGAIVTGYALPPPAGNTFYQATGLDQHIHAQHLADIRDLGMLRDALQQAQAEVVLHLAAQPLVRLSYAEPLETFSTNVMGTANLLEAIRTTPSVKAVVVVTSDKCYENREWHWGYRENEAMGGHDPYSASKGCAELVTASYRRSFFNEGTTAIASARAGNVIGGGDWSSDRLVPDALAAFGRQEPVRLRNPESIRPWQHVLEPLCGYLLLAQSLYEHGESFAEGFNFGPHDVDARPVREVIDLIIANWQGPARRELDAAPQPHEAHFLKLDCSKARAMLGWQPRWHLETAIARTVQWHDAWLSGADMAALCEAQIQNYLEYGTTP